MFWNCHKSFPTDQALGGQKWYHYAGGVTISDGCAASSSISRHGFDLKLPVPLTELRTPAGFYSGDSKKNKVNVHLARIDEQEVEIESPLLNRVSLVPFINLFLV